MVVSRSVLPDAMLWRLLTLLAVALCLQGVAVGAVYQTDNFISRAATSELAREVGETAERLRREIAIEWLGAAMPNWSAPCPITVRVSPSLGAAGSTKFLFDRGEVFGWEMSVQGSRQRVLDSVLPHEITHTVFACHFRRPLPRWADEGAASTAEHPDEIRNLERQVVRHLKTNRGIPFSLMIRQTDYPPDVLPLYAQGHSVATFLIEQRGRGEFLAFLSLGMTGDDWPAAVRRHYGYTSLRDVQDSWLNWVRAGRPRLAFANQLAEGVR